MSVHYKFKSALDFDTISFDGLHISVNDLKKAITHQKRLGKISDFDLQITNAQTKEEYGENSALIPKNTSLIIARIPLVQPKKSWDPQTDKTNYYRPISEHERGEVDLSQMNGSEEDKIQAMMVQSTIDYDPMKYQKLRGQGQTGEVPSTYRCFKCHKPGHWIKNCPLNTSTDFDHKKNTGIPRSFLQEREAGEKVETVHQPIPVETKQEIPDDLICNICKDLFTDAVMIPCCGSSFCDDCVRTALLESEDNECPDCNEKGSSPGSLIPNRFLRNSVNAFKNETGYNKPQKRKEIPKPVETARPPVEVESTKPAPVVEVTNEETTEATETVEKENKSDPNTKKSENPTSHDEIESDYEDNITVTVPPPHLQAHKQTYKERSFNGKNSRNPRPPGMENSPKLNIQASPTEENPEEIESVMQADQHSNQQHISSNILVHREPTSSIRVHRINPPDMYGNMQGMPQYPQNMGMAGPGNNMIRHYHMNNYGPQNPGGYPQYNMGERARGPVGVPRPGFHGSMSQMRPRLIPTNSNLESVYQGVAAKVGGMGIIDDPLEAFNRIMREKEKRKEERRRSPDRRRSRSIEMRSQRGRHSPVQRNRLRTPENRRRRSPPMRDRRDRSRNRDKRMFDMDKNKRRSSSFSDRSSRSWSWSNMPRRRSKTPPNIRKTSRSGSPRFNYSRSRSRSNSHSRFKGPSKAPMRYNRSPLRSMSPRYRFKDVGNRRDDYRENSPYRETMRSRSRDRTSGNQFNRPDRSGGFKKDNYVSNHVSSGESYHDGSSYSRNKRYSRDRHMKTNEPYVSHERIPIKDNKGSERYNDDAPPGTVEPPPPGFEVPIQQQQQQQHGNHTWQPNQFDDFRSTAATTSTSSTMNVDKNQYRMRLNSSERERGAIVQDFDIHDHLGIQQSNRRDDRSWSRTRSSPHNSSSNNVRGKKRRSSHSRTPDNHKRFIESERDCMGEKDAQKKDSSRTTTTTDEKLNMDDKRNEKQLSNNSKTEKQNREDISKMKSKEKERHKNTEKEKRKGASEIEDDKKDKKNKERKKKKKDKDDKDSKKKLKKKDRKEKDKTKNKSDKNLSENENQFMPDKDECETNIVTGGTCNNIDTNKENLLISTDLYGDICQAEEINYNYAKNPNNESIVENDDKGEIDKFDSSLLDLNPDFSDLNFSEIENKSTENCSLPMPEPSKWELDDDGQNIRDDNKNDFVLSGDDSYIGGDKSDKVTTEVIKRAENAIFKRAINAIRPSIEIKTISADRQKLYSNENINESLSPVIMNTSVPDNLNVKTSASNSSNEKSDDLKTEKQTKQTKSVKERLGPILKPKSVNNSPKNSSSSDTTLKSKDKDKDDKEKKFDQNSSRSSSNRRGSEIKRPLELHRNNDGDNFQRDKNAKNRNPTSGGNSSNYNRHKNPFSTDRRMNFENPRKFYDNKDNRRGSDDNKNSRNQSREFFNDRNRSTNNDRFSRRSRSKEFHSKNKNDDRKRQRSKSNSLDRNEKRTRRDQDTSTNRNMKNFDISKSSNTSNERNTKTLDTTTTDTKSNANNRKRDNNKPSEIDNTTNDNDSIIKSTKSQSAATTSSSSSDSGGSESDDQKKKRRKHRKDRKKSKRSTSPESNDSAGKRKRSKSKKKNKSAKKKKKSKK